MTESDLHVMTEELRSFLVHKNPPTAVSLAAMLILLNELAMSLTLAQLHSLLEITTVVMSHWADRPNALFILADRIEDLQAAEIAREEGTLC